MNFDLWIRILCCANTLRGRTHFLKVSSGVSVFFGPWWQEIGIPDGVESLTFSFSSLLIVVSSWPSSVFGHTCVITRAKAWLDLSPLGEVILASKLSAMACTRPIFDDWIPVNCVLFDAATAADALNHNSSSYEQQIPRSWNCCTRLFLPRVIPSPIWSGVGWFVTALVMIFPITIDGSLNQGLSDSTS